MPKSETDNVLFLLQCLASATQNNGKIDFKAIGSTLQNGATANALYLRLNRIKKSANFSEVGSNTTTVNDPTTKHAEDADNSNNNNDGKDAAATSTQPAKASKKRKASTNNATDPIAPLFTAVDKPSTITNSTTDASAPTPAKKQKQQAGGDEKKAQKQKSAKKPATEKPFIPDKVMFDAATSYANAMHPIPSLEEVLEIEAKAAKADAREEEGV